MPPLETRCTTEISILDTGYIQRNEFSYDKILALENFFRSWTSSSEKVIRLGEGYPLSRCEALISELCRNDATKANWVFVWGFNKNGGTEYYRNIVLVSDGDKRNGVGDEIVMILNPLSVNTKIRRCYVFGLKLFEK